jgi:predicted acyltransferase
MIIHGSGPAPSHMRDLYSGRNIASADAVSPQSTRLLSLDAFRGITIAGMLLVNNPGSWSTIYDPLEHAAWHGWTPTDLIFPFFLFIVGVAMTMSLGKLLAHGHSRNRLLVKSAKRAALIFIVGLALHSFPWIGYDFSTIRIPGVLQRIAVAYLIASIIYLFVTTTKGRVVALALLLFGYWGLQTMVPVPGGLTGVLQPGLDLGAYIDRAVFTEAHLWKSAKTWDPEGLLSTLPAVGTVLLGVFTGQWIASQRTPHEKAAGLFAAGLLGMIAGAMWGWSFPINKNLWTSSYVLFTGGIAAQTLGLCYWLIDVQGYRKWAHPFVIYGTNALAAFVLSGIFARTLSLIKLGADDTPLKTLIYRNVYLSWATPHVASLAFAISFVLLWLGIMSVFYYKRIFIKL